MTFAIGAYAVWGSTFYQRVRGMDEAQAGSGSAILTAVAGLLGIALGTVAADCLAQVHPAGLPALAGDRGGDRRPLLSSARPRPDRRTVARPALRRVGPDGLGARAVQRGDGQRRPGQPAGRGLRAVHLPDPPVRRHQLADPDRPISDLFGKPSSPTRRWAGCSNRSGPGHALARPADEPDGRDARGRPDARPRLPLLPPGIAYLPEDQERAETAGGGDPLDEPIVH